MTPLVIRKCLRSLLLNYLSKLYYSSELFPALPLSLRRGGWGVRLFFICKREDVKSSFTSSLLGYILFSVPFFQLPTTCISTRILLYLPPLRGKELGKSLLGDLYLLTNVDWTNAVHIMFMRLWICICISNRSNIKPATRFIECK